MGNTIQSQETQYQLTHIHSQEIPADQMQSHTLVGDQAQDTLGKIYSLKQGDRYFEIVYSENIFGKIFSIKPAFRRTMDGIDDTKDLNPHDGIPIALDLIQCLASDFNMLFANIQYSPELEAIVCCEQPMEENNLFTRLMR